VIPSLLRSTAGDWSMMGRMVGGQAKLFYEFNLDERVPSGHLLRRIDAVLDLGDLHSHLASFCSQTVRS
jgi:hypothetical protein